ncbi:MAG: hypothetical protein RBT20_10140 [Syntrophales bacterium]|jgi:Tfp pilus assembly protein PilO|nr:hypothetical protein [Syntrophales bacterium]
MAAHSRFHISFREGSTVYCILSVIGVLLFVFAAILPYSRAAKSLDERITVAKKQIQEQESFKAIHDRLQKGLQKQEATVLPLPVRTPLKRTDAGSIPGLIRETAVRSGLDLVSVTPDLNFLAGGAPLLPVAVSLRGDFFRFRNFLSALGAMPYMDRIEEIAVNRGRDAMEYKMRILLSVGS